jgi:hypothetical protein
VAYRGDLAPLSQEILSGNLLNRPNFNAPNLIVFTPPSATNPTDLLGTAGVITSTSTTSREVQFALKLLW